MESFSSLDMTFVRAWKEILGSSPADWTPKACADGHSSFISFHDWWSRSQPAVNLQIFRETIRQLRSRYGQPTYEDVVRVYSRRAGLSGDRRQRVSCTSCDGTGIVCFPQLSRRGVVYAVDPAKALKLQLGEYIGEGTAPCGYCDAGKATNERWHMPRSVLDRCNRCRMTPSELDSFRASLAATPVRNAHPPDEHPPKEAIAAVAVPSLRAAGAMLRADDSRRQENEDKWAGVPPEDRF